VSGSDHFIGKHVGLEKTMRLAAAACALAIVVCLAVFGAVLAQRATAPTVTPAPSVAAIPAQKMTAAQMPAPAKPAVNPSPVVTTAAAATPVATPIPTIEATPAAPAAAPAPPPPPAPVNCPGNPNALGVSRVVEIDTTGGPGFGFQHFKQYDFLRPGEVVLSFDDGPWPHNTPAVLAALAGQCTKAIFFPIGEHTMWAPEILRQVEAAGHTIGSHTWSHKDLTKLTAQDAKDEIEKGISAVKWGLGHPASPFFRFPDLRHPPEMVTYLGTRNIAIFSTDMDSFDFKLHKPEQVINSVLTKLKKNGKGIVLMHDFQRATAEAMPELLKQLKTNGYKIVFVKSKEPAVTTLAAYDDVILKENKLPTVTDKPVSDVVRTVN
jgi:peptidoglycan/xylan/chitin deacetylase (PgdA/CDA1 family)